MADDPLQRAILQHGSTIEEGKTTFKVTADDGSEFKIKIEKDSSPKETKKSKIDKLMKVLPWNKSPSPKNRSKAKSFEFNQDYDITTQAQGFDSDPLYDTIDENNIRGVDSNRNYYRQSPPSSSQSTSASVYETSLATLDRSHGNHGSKDFIGQSAIYMGTSLCDSLPRQDGDPSHVNHIYLQPSITSHHRGHGTSDTPTENHNARVKRHQTHIPRHISESKCPNVDNGDWENLCDEFSECDLQNSCDSLSHEETNKWLQVYDTPRNLTNQGVNVYDTLKGVNQNKSSTSNAFSNAMADFVPGMRKRPFDENCPDSPKVLQKIPSDVAIAKCPSIDEDEWDRLGSDLFE